MPEQEFPPPRRPARNYRPDRDEDDPPPWANLPSVRPTRPAGAPSGPGGGGRHGRPASSGPRPDVPAGLGAPARHRSPSAPDGPGDAEYSASAEYPVGTDYPAATDYPIGTDYPGGADHPGGAGDSSGTAAPQAASGPREDEQVPSWAQWQESGDGDEADLPSMRPHPPRDRGASRALRAAARRRRRWLITGGGVAVLAGAIVAVVLLTTSHKPPPADIAGALVTTFQHGELQQVPNACHVVPAATVQQYLPGKAKVAAPLSVSGPAGSACDWTIDQPPQYRLMELSLQAYAPNGLASGNGSATQAATDAYQLAFGELRTPPKNAPAAARATVQALTGFGDAAFTAQQVFHVGGAVTDVATVMVRYRNVVVTVTLNGLAHSNKGNYGPVSPSQLAQAAMAFAQAAETSLR